MAQYSTKSADPHVILDLKVNSREAIDAIISAKEQLASLKNEQKQLEAEMRKGAGTKEMKERLVMIKTEMTDLNTVIRANQRELDNNVKAYKQNGDSLNAMRAQLSNMRIQFEDMTKAERESASGEALLAHIKSITEEIKELEQAQGDFRRSVGTYGKLFDTTTESMQSFGSTLASIFGQNSIIGKAATVVTGFARGMSEMSKGISEITDKADKFSSAMGATAKTMGDTAKSASDVASTLNETAAATQAASNATDQASTVVQGFGAAERAAADAAKGMAAGEQAAATATAAAGTAASASTSVVKKLAVQVGALSKQLLKLMANPYVALIGAIIVILLKLVDTFKKNDQAMTALQSAMNAFRPILDGINKLFNVLVGVVTKVITTISNLVSGVLSLVPAFKSASDASKQYIEDVDKLEEAERQYTVESAKNEAKIAELRDKAADKEHYTAEERIKFNKEAQKLEEDNYKKQKALAKERLRLAKEEQKRDNDWSDERENKIAELEAAYIKADADYANAHRSLMKEQMRFEREVDAEEKEAKKEKERQAKEWAQKQKEMRKNELQAIRDYQDAVLEASDEGLEKQLKSIELAGKREIEDLKLRLKEEANLTKKARENINKLIELKQKELNKKLILEQAKYWAETRVEIEKAMSSALTFIDTGKLNTDFKAASDIIKSNILKIQQDAQNTIDNLNASFKKEVENLAKTSSVAKYYMRFTPEIDIQNFQKQMDALAKVIEQRTGKDGWAKITADGAYEQLYEVYERFQQILASQQRQIWAQMQTSAESSAKVMQQAIFNAITNGSVDAYKEFIATVPDYARDMAAAYGDNYLDQMRGILQTIDSDIEARYKDIAQYAGTNEAMEQAARERLAILEKVREVILQTNSEEEYQLRIRREHAQLTIDGLKNAITEAQFALQQDQHSKEKLVAQRQYMLSVEEEVRAKAENLRITKEEARIKQQQLKDQKATLEAQLSEMNNNISLGIEVDPSALQQLQQQIADIQAEEQRLMESVALAAQEMASTGFASLDEFNEKLEETDTKILESNAKIAEDTRRLHQEQIDGWMNTFNGIANAASALTGAFGDLFNTLAEDNEEMQKYSNAMALVDVMVTMAQGIATAVAEGMKMGWPAAAVMIPIGIATVVGGIAQAIAIIKKNKVKNSPKFAEGGLVGNRTTTKTDDKVNARLSEGEYVIRSKVVKALGVDFFDRLNGKKLKKQDTTVLKFASGGVVPSMTTIKETSSNLDYDKLSDIVSEIQPVVSVQEINAVQTRVNVKEQTASYK